MYRFPGEDEERCKKPDEGIEEYGEDITSQQRQPDQERVQDLIVPANPLLLHLPLVEPAKIVESGSHLSCTSDPPESIAQEQGGV